MEGIALRVARANSRQMIRWRVGRSLTVGMCGALCAAFFGTTSARPQVRGPVALPEGVSLRLAVKDGKTSFKMGEPIDLELTVSGDSKGFDVGAWDGDHIDLQPEGNVFRWAGLFSSDTASIVALTPQGRTFTSRLNDQFQIKEPGTYTALVHTWRVMKKPETPSGMSQSMEIVSNTVTFEVQAANEQDEAARVKVLGAKVQSAVTPEEAKKAWDELAYLTGDAAAREKVRLVLAAWDGELKPFSAASEETSRIGDADFAFAQSKNKRLEIDLLHAAWLDVRNIPDEGWLNSMTALARLDAGIGMPDTCGMCGMPRTKWEDKMALEKPYVDEIVATMPQRTGENRKETGAFLYQELMTSPARPGYDVARSIVISNFENDSVDEQKIVMQCWNGINIPPSSLLRDPLMIPVVERIVGSVAPDEKDSDGENTDRHSCALMRLVEVAPERAVPYFVEELEHPDVELKLYPFGELKEATLAQVDKVLLGQIQTFAAEGAKEPGTGVKDKNDVMQAQASLMDRTLLAARYASPAIYAPMLVLYEQYSGRWDSEQRGAVLAYLLRWNPAKTMPLVRAAIAPDDLPFSNAVSTIGKVYSYIPMPFPPELRADLVQTVEHGSYKQTSMAAVQLSMHGEPEDEAVLTKRLAAIEAELKLHPERLGDFNFPGGTMGLVDTEVALIGALRTDKVWHPTEGRLAALREDCLGALCHHVTATAIIVGPGY
jgi:hypothetical protein